MSWIRTVDEGDAQGPLAGLYRRAADPDTGRVDNILKIHALHPAGLKAHLDLYLAVMRGSEGLPTAERELIALVVSRLNRCRY